MKNLLSILAILCFSSYAFCQKRIVILGSSTSAGYGATSYDSSWVGRLQHEYSKNTSDGVDTTIINLAHGGYSTYKVMPSDFISTIAGRPLPCVDSNITKALTYNPDLILINLPTNDIASSFSEQEEMNNFRQLVQIITSHGIKYFITTSQGRNDIDSLHRQQLRQLADSIDINFSANVINFWDDLISSDGYFKLRTELTADGIHPNNNGHRLLFQRVKDKSIFSDTIKTFLNIHVEAEKFNKMSGVGTETTMDINGGLNVSYIDTGDWMEYNIYAPSAGNYKINFRIATPSANASLQVKKADGSILRTVKLPNTGGFQVWQTVSSVITLGQGFQTIRLVSTSPQWNDWNINWFDIKSITQVFTPTPVVTSTSEPIHIEAENYVTMSGVATENTKDSGGGLNVSYIDTGDWMSYTVTVPAAGTYKVNFRVASPASNAQLQVKKADGSLLATVNVPNTGGFQVWHTISSSINLVQGKQTINIFSSSPLWNDWNINWFDLICIRSLSNIAASPKSLKELNPEAIEHVSINKVFLSSNRLNAEIYAGGANTGDVSIYSMSGLLISKERYAFTGAVSQYTTRLPFLNAGIYLLSVTTPSGRDTKQFVVVK